MKRISSILTAVCLLLGFIAKAQDEAKASQIGRLSHSTFVPSIASQIKNGTAKYADNKTHIGRPKGISTPIVVPGKGSKGIDPLINKQRSFGQSFNTKSPEVVFTADISSSTPSDPTGAAGPNHYVAAWNVGFRIYNKDGSPATPEMGLNTLFPGNSTGDPIVFFDANVDNGAGKARGRYVITEFRNSGAPGGNGFDVAISAGPDPVNDPWYIYEAQFNAGVFPDYTKFSVWGDSYIVTANISSTTEQIFALERNPMLNDEAAQFLTFGLPGIQTGGFYSPQGFHTTGDETVPAGTPAPIIYQQDDAWTGVDNDHLKIWEATIDWETPANSSIALSQEIQVADFVGVFDGGSFSNIPQPGGPDVDALQATMMNQVQYRRFPTYNSVVLNFVVNVADPDEKAGMRWYELRQTTDGEDWTIYQEGTYVVPGKRSAYQGSVVMDSQGNIAMGYISSSSEDGIKMHYTGRFDGDPLGVMTVAEQDLFVSTAASPTDRLADYTQITLDPIDDSFWYISEQFAPTRRDIVGNFNLDPAVANDLSPFAIISPAGDGVYTNAEVITFTIKNFGNNTITNPTVQYTINGSAPVVETFTGTIDPFMTAEFTFSQSADLSTPDTTYTIAISTNLANDSNVDNDELVCVVTNTFGQACQPSGNCQTDNDGVILITLADQTNLAPACNDNGFENATDTVFTFTDRGSLSGTLQLGFNDSAFAIWIDINDDLTFTSDELVAANDVPNGNTDFEFMLDITGLDETQLLAGPHRMRIRGEDKDQGGDVQNPCDDLSFGRTTDYTAVFEADVLGIESNVFEETSLSITSNDNNHFKVLFKTDFDGRVSVSVYNLAGQRLAQNNLKSVNNLYDYDLDMSYVASGVYIVKISDIDGGSSMVEKIIVE